MDLVIARPQGLYCRAGDFYIDPWRPVARAVITHAHGDHASRGHGHYLASTPSETVLRSRLGDIALQTLSYGESVKIGDATVSLHPAGHVLGSAQVRIAARGQVWVASGDYKLAPDPTCTPFEPVRCDTFITESTFGLPLYRWPAAETVAQDIAAWWQANANAGRASVLYCYSFGKAQRLLAMLERAGPLPGPIFCHGAVEVLNDAYRDSGVALPETARVPLAAARGAAVAAYRQALIVAPPSAAGSTWLRRFGDYSDGFASGWMLVRGARRRRGVDRGFVLSDHADWPDLNRAIGATGAERIIVTHGQVAPLVRWLREQGLEADAFRTEYGGEEEYEGKEEAGSATSAATPAADDAATAGAMEQATTGRPAIGAATSDDDLATRRVPVAARAADGSGDEPVPGTGIESASATGNAGEAGEAATRDDGRPRGKTRRSPRGNA
ncbi:putative mRNA 3-end processing factor [Chitinasiproducens palmae]|uniref:Putative mRNA 3-end processing factor n=1 Tax=Chitinasiproducens palmae TaxID=1770053 RepID=A0A1H2PQT0_9BURK|nr:ligase-associated DNA damage response exonuclease [Chitinasiproducens palmae]SDV49106.1 putative mRNA 3-end processing factor [Chitinasiproducens palmae]